MKKIIYAASALLLTIGSISASKAQAVSDRAVIPVAINLNQVLRLHVWNGGNIEFVFNTIDDYRNGLSGDDGTSSSANTAATGPGAAASQANAQGVPGGPNNFYNTYFTVSSSTDWSLDFGAEQATFVGTDNVANKLNLNNVGYQVFALGNHTFGAGNELGDPAGANAGVIALAQYPVTIIEKEAASTVSNAGDEDDNAFEIIWRCGTSEGTMNGTSLLDQGVTPDRYVTNVMMELLPQ
ncbi:MAG: hypothetical protein D6707_11385 [Bacteroidetes bacterium]|nr:MAG: hypothetical protein D6707_11385 [Bacteroidota bacterium]